MCSIALCSPKHTHRVMRGDHQEPTMHSCSLLVIVARLMLPLRRKEGRPVLEAGFAQLRFAASILFGTRFSLRSLDRLIAALQATQREFGVLGAEGRDLLVSPQLDEETRRA